MDKQENLLQRTAETGHDVTRKQEMRPPQEGNFFVLSLDTAGHSQESPPHPEAYCRMWLLKND
jgi:hypothetical protein